MLVVAFIDNSLLQALLYCYLALSVYLSLRIMDFPDLTIEGSFPLGAAVAAGCITYFNSPTLGVILGISAGYAAGALTAFLYEYLGIGKLLSGIVVATGLYSVSFRFMGANANLYLDAANNPSTRLNDLNNSIVQYIFGADGYLILYPLTNLFLGLFLVLVMYALYRYLTSSGGTLLRFSREDSRGLVAAVGFDAKRAMIHGLGMANALAALAGVLVVFNDGSASISMGFGIILTALASLVIGERLVSLFHKDKADIWPMLLAPILGTLVYHMIIKAVRSANVYAQSVLGFPDPHNQFQFFNTDIRILTAMIIILLYYPQSRARGHSNPFDRL
ncbi:MAG: hypothetical protein WAT12_09090 [Candidatus Nitrotoga sp.]